MGLEWLFDSSNNVENKPNELKLMPAIRDTWFLGQYLLQSQDR